MRYAVLAAGSRPVCVWGDEVKGANRRFVEGIAFGYFGYVGRLHLAQLEGDQAQLAAMAIRTAFYHGLETLFTLIGAAVQAPHCVPAWIDQCKTGCLRRFVEAVQEGTPVRNELELVTVSWEAIANKLLEVDFNSPEEAERVRGNYARLWRRLAADFLDEHHIQEYNSLKHGLRVKPGGFSFNVGEPAEAGGPPSLEAMHSLGSSVYGSRFYDLVPIDPDRQGESHFRCETVCLNWSAVDTVAALELISYSLQNVCAWLRHWAGEGPESLPPVVWPADAAFDLPWTSRAGVHSLRQSTTMTEEHIHRMSDEELLDILDWRQSPDEPLEQASDEPSV